MHWINVKDRLPDSWNEVVVWLGDDWTRGWYKADTHEWIDDLSRTCYPTHWAEVTKPDKSK